MAQKNADFYAGIISALAVIELHHADTIHEEIVALCDLDELLQHAKTNEEIEFAGLERYEAQPRFAADGGYCPHCKVFGVYEGCCINCGVPAATAKT